MDFHWLKRSSDDLSAELAHFSELEHALGQSQHCECFLAQLTDRLSQAGLPSCSVRDATLCAESVASRERLS